MTEKEIYTALWKDIQDGRITGMLPSISMMKSRFRTSHNTIHMALNRLKMQGVVYGRQGKGVFVNENALSLRKTGKAALIMPSLQQFLMNPFYVNMLIVLKDALSKAGYDLSLISDLKEDIKEYSAAIITNANLIPEETLLSMKYALSGRICLLNHKKDGFISVSNDNFQGGRLAAERLYQAGHRNIGVVTCYLDLPYNFFYDRFEGIKSFARRHRDFHITEFPVSDTGPDSNISDIGKKLLSDYPEITGLFTFKTGYAPEIQQVFKHSNRKISIVGYGESPYAPFLDPPLTTIKEDHAALGEALCRTVCTLAAGKKPVGIDIPVELIERESVFEIANTEN